MITHDNNKDTLFRQRTAATRLVVLVVKYSLGISRTAKNISDQFHQLCIYMGQFTEFFYNTLTQCFAQEEYVHEVHQSVQTAHRQETI